MIELRSDQPLDKQLDTGLLIGVGIQESQRIVLNVLKRFCTHCTERGPNRVAGLAQNEFCRTKTDPIENQGCSTGVKRHQYRATGRVRQHIYSRLVLTGRSYPISRHRRLEGAAVDAR